MSILWLFPWQLFRLISNVQRHLCQVDHLAPVQKEVPKKMNKIVWRRVEGMKMRVEEERRERGKKGTKTRIKEGIKTRRKEKMIIR